MVRPSLWLGAGFALLTLLLAGCGSGGGTTSTSTSTSTGTVSAFITDNLAEDYEAVWVTLHEVTVIPTDGEAQTIYENAEGETVNLTSLDGVGELLSVSELPAGNYDTFEVRLDNELSLVPSNGDDAISAYFSNNGSTDYTTEVSGDLVVKEGATTAFALDFDLEEFDYDPDTDVVSPKVVAQDEEEVKLLQRTFAKMDAVVTEIVDDTTFKVRNADDAEGPEVTANLHAAASVFEPGQGKPDRDTSPLAVGYHVNVNGNYDPATATVTAVSVKIESTGEDDEGDGESDEAEGTVSTYDADTGTAQLTVSDASFLPGAETIKVINLGNAEYARGSTSQLEEGVEIEVSGTWDGLVLSAEVVEIEGGEPGHDPAGEDDLTEIEARVEGLHGKILTVTILEQDDDAALSSPLRLDIAGVWFKNGNRPCLKPDVTAEIKADLAAGEASVIELDDDAFGAHPGCQVTAKVEEDDEADEEADDSEETTDETTETED
ncbi:DUF4382 domain-containing protein [Thiohalorhabdus sp.]|uniref:DUF4382 domain-containing protein n=1 Tax=Thiohalorhabdus sp. TaxID=3094134 RepID=UPI002FC2C18F